MTKILYPATYRANFGRGKDKRRRRRRNPLGITRLVGEGLRSGYQIGRNSLSRVGNAIDGAVTGGALGIAAKAGAYGLRGTGRLWRRKLEGNHLG
jgi:hypothetical protein